MKLNPKRGASHIVRDGLCGIGRRMHLSCRYLCVVRCVYVPTYANIIMPICLYVCTDVFYRKFSSECKYACRCLCVCVCMAMYV